MAEVQIDKITASLEKKYNGNQDHDVKVIQEYCRTLPPCEESAKLIEALGRYAADKFPDAEAFKVVKLIKQTIADLETKFTDDQNENVKIVRDFCKSLPRTEDNNKLVVALGQYAATKFPEADEVKKSKEEFDKIQAAAADMQKKLNDIQELIKNKDYDKAIEGIQAIINETKLPETTDKRFISLSHPFEEVLVRTMIKETRTFVRISNLLEMLHFQLAEIFATTGKYAEAREALQGSIEFNPVSAPAHLELARVAILDGKYDTAFADLTAAYPLLFTRQHLAIYYCLLAEVVENLDKNYQLAVGYVYESIDFADMPRAHEVLNHLAKHPGIDLNKPKPVDIKKLADEASLPVGPSKNVCELAINTGRQFKASQPEIAKQFLAIAYDLTKNPALLKEMK